MEKKYQDKLIDEYAPKMLPSWLNPSHFMRGLAQIESSGDIFTPSRVGAEGWFQIMKPTFDGVMTRIVADSSKFDFYFPLIFIPKANFFTSSYHINDVISFLERNDPNWDTYSVIEKQARIVMVYNCGQLNYKENNYVVEGLGEETIGQYQKMKNYLMTGSIWKKR